MDLVKITIALLLTFAVAAFAAETKRYYEYPDITTLPDTARVPLYDPTAPGIDKSRNITGSKLKEILSVPGPQGPQGYRGYSGAKGDKGEKGDKGDTGNRGYDGRPGSTLRCTILDGTRGVTYDSTGLNPQPATLNPFFAYLYLDTQLVTPVWYEWYIPSTASQLKWPPVEPDGMQVHRQYFQPQVFGTWSAARANNYISVQMAYSSPRPPYGRRYCDTSIPFMAVKSP